MSWNPNQFVAVKRLKYSDEIEKIYMPAKTLRAACGIFCKINVELPRETEIKEEVFPAFRVLINTAESLVQAYCESLRQHLNETADEIAFATDRSKPENDRFS